MLTQQTVRLEQDVLKPDRVAINGNLTVDALAVVLTTAIESGKLNAPQRGELEAMARGHSNGF